MEQREKLAVVDAREVHDVGSAVILQHTRVVDDGIGDLVRREDAMTVDQDVLHAAAPHLSALVMIADSQVARRAHRRGG
ncbi:hypothetical protein [Microbacterium aurum]